MSAAMIAFHARRNPGALAVIAEDGRQFSYQQMHRLLQHAMHRLSAALKPFGSRQLVGVACQDRRWHLMVMLALEALGVRILPFVQPFDPGFEATLADCDLIISDLHGLPGQDLLLLSAAWFAETNGVFEDADLPAHRWPLCASPIVLVTSGSSGVSKSVPLTQQAVDARDHNRIWQYGLSATSRFLVAIPASVTGVLFTMRAVFRCGGALVYWSVSDPIKPLKASTHAILLPVHLRTLLASLPHDYRPDQRLKLFVLGARLAAALRDRAVARLQAEVQGVYGSNEGGACVWLGAQETGQILPGVEIKIVDQRLQPLPRGVPGTILVRAPEMGHAYLDPGLAAARFVDGWFNTGDVGILHGARTMQLQGRTDDMMNIGGVKVSPEDLEDKLMHLGFARDLAVCTRPDADGIGELYILVDSPTTDDARMLSLVGSVVGHNFGRVRVVRVAQLPRSGPGKLQRAQLAQLVDQYLPQKI